MKPAPLIPFPVVPPAGEIEARAADWLARREAGLSVDEQAEFSRWLLADSRHAEAVKQVQTDWLFLQKPRATGQADEVVRAIAARVAAKTRTRRRWLAASFGGMAAAAALVFALLPSKAPDVTASAGPTLASVVVRPEQQTLPDGSIVEFNAGTEIAVNFTPEQRHVTLVRGEAHFIVTKNPARPFTVSAGSVRVRAVGTAFNVRFEPAQVGVLVTEGRVAVERTELAPVSTAMAVGTQPVVTYVAPEPTPVFLDAGNRLDVPVQSRAVAAGALAPTQVTDLEMKAALAWRDLRVEFTNTPLAEVITLFNRQNRVQLSLGDPALAHIRISGIFWSDDPEGFSRLLGSIADLHAEPLSATAIELRR